MKQNDGMMAASESMAASPNSSRSHGKHGGHIASTALVALALGWAPDAFAEAGFSDFPGYDSPFSDTRPTESGSRRFSQGHRQTVPSGDMRIAVLAGYRYWPQGSFELSARDAGYPIRNRAMGGAQFGVDFGYRLSDTWDVSLEIGYGMEFIDFAAGKTLHSNMPLLVLARFIPWPGKVEPFFGVGGGYVLNFYSGGVLDYLESNSMGVAANAGIFVSLSRVWSFLAELRFTYAVSEMGTPYKNRMGGGVSLFVGVQWAIRATSKELR